MAASGPTRIGPFEVRGRLGAGGMAEAFEAARTGPGGFEQRVCVKRVLPAYSTDPEFVRLFLREARVAAALSHRNVTRVVDFGEDGGCHYLALELVDGMDLRRLCKLVPERRLPVQVVALIGMEIAEALEHAHTRGGRTGPVIHRDVSPANVLLSVDGDVKLTDFGISKALGEASITRGEHARGNVWYMAPEVLEGGSRSSPFSDQFSLGVVLYQCLSGRRPYDGPNDVAAMVALSEGRRVPLREAAPGLPEPIVMTVERLLSQRPEDRFPSAGSAAEALAPLTQVASARRALRELVRTLGADPHRPPPPRNAGDWAWRPEGPAGGSGSGSDAGGGHGCDRRVGAGPGSGSGSRSGTGSGSGSGSGFGSGTGSGAGAGLVAARRRPSPTFLSTADSRERERESGPSPRWRPYSFAPGVWASVDRAADIRKRRPRAAPGSRSFEARSPTASNASAPVLPMRSTSWIAAALLALAVLGVTTFCLTWLLAM